MTLTNQIQINNKKILSNTNDNLLDVLLNNNIDINHACKTGNCQSCLIKCTQGEVPQASQKGLKSTLKAQNYLLACQCKIQSDMTLSLKEIDGLKVTTKVTEIKRISDNLIILILALPANFHYAPGQSLILWKNKTQGRNYSIANVSTDGTIELHIKKYPTGIVTPWIFNKLNISDPIEIQGPCGRCFYTKSQVPLLLIGNGTGLSPLIGIIRQAIKEQHSQKIHLIHYARENSQIYYQEEINLLCKQHKNITYEPLIKDEPSHKTLVDIAKTKIIENKSHNIYLAGSDGLINLLRKQLYIAGASLSAIYSDAFIPRDVKK